MPRTKKQKSLDWGTWLPIGLGIVVLIGAGIGFIKIVASIEKTDAESGVTYTCADAPGKPAEQNIVVKSESIGKNTCVLLGTDEAGNVFLPKMELKQADLARFAELDKSTAVGGEGVVVSLSPNPNRKPSEFVLITTPDTGIVDQVSLKQADFISDFLAEVQPRDHIRLSIVGLDASSNSCVQTESIVVPEMKWRVNATKYRNQVKLTFETPYVDAEQSVQGNGAVSDTIIALINASTCTKSSKDTTGAIRQLAISAQEGVRYGIIMHGAYEITQADRRRAGGYPFTEDGFKRCNSDRWAHYVSTQDPETKQGGVWLPTCERQQLETLRRVYGDSLMFCKNGPRTVEFYDLDGPASTTEFSLAKKHVFETLFDGCMFNYKESTL